MFKSLKKKPDKVKEKLDFKLGFHATRVPSQGWDKLVITVIPYETNRPVAKTPRAVVKNGECHWPDSIIETTRMVYDTRTSSYEEKKYRFMVSSGSSRSGVLGEITINFGDFAASKHPQQKGLALRNCNTGTLLHVTVTCLTPKSHDSVKDSDKPTKLTHEGDEEEDLASEDDDLDRLNRVSSNGYMDSPRKPSLDSPPLSPSSTAGRKLQQRNISTSSLRYSSSSFDSLEVPSTPGTASFTDALHGYPEEFTNSSSSSFSSMPTKLDRSKDNAGVGSKPSSPLPSYGHNQSHSLSATSSGRQQVGPTERTQNISWSRHSEHTHGDSGEAFVSTSEDPQLMAASSQRQSLKSNSEADKLDSKPEKNMQVSQEKGMDLSALKAVRGGLKQEVENLSIAKQAPRLSETGVDESRGVVEDAHRIINELKEEILSEKNTISNLNLQLQKTEQDNRKLVSEIDVLLDAAKSSNVAQSADDSLAHVEKEWATKLSVKDEEMKNLQTKILYLEERVSQVQTNTIPHKGGGNDALVTGLQNMVKQLQQDVEELEADIIRLTEEKSELLAQLESSARNSVSKSSDVTPQIRATENLVKQLQKDVEELEVDTVRLTEENVELLSKLKSSSLELSEKNRLIADLMESESSKEGRAELLDKVASLEGELTLLKEETVQILHEKEEAEVTIHRLQTENQELLKSIRNLEGSQPDRLDRNKDKEVANNQLFQQLAETVTGLEEELRESQEETRLSRLRIEELEHDISGLTYPDQSSVELEALRKLVESEKLEKENIQRTAEEKTRVSQERLVRAFEEKEKMFRRVSDLELELEYTIEDRDFQRQEVRVVEEEKSHLLSEKERLQIALDSTTEKHHELVKHLTEELEEAIKECEVLKNSQHHLEQEVVRLQGELEEAHHDLRERTKTFETSRAMLEESFHTISRDHANAVAVSKTLEAQVSQLQSDLEDMETRSATKLKTLSMLKESEQLRLEKSEQVLLHSASLQKDNAALEKRVADLELLLEDNSGDGRANSNGLLKSNNGNESHELTRVKNENSALSQQIKELESQLLSQADLQSEVFRLREANEVLDSELQKYKATVAGSNMVDKVVHLETELAEALEANNMYKLQLRSAFAEQQNVHAVALQNSGDVDRVVNDRVGRNRVKQLEDELRDMRDRYSTMSLRFAEVEVEREELVMTIRTLRNTRR